MPVRPSIRDIAKLAGVSKSAVSLVLRDQPGISAATRKKVHQAAETLGYIPDPALSKIAAHRWRSTQFASETAIAIITASGRNNVARLTGVRQTAAKLGYRLDEVRLTSSSTFPALAHQLYHRGVRGILLPPLAEGMGFEDADWSPFSLLAMGRGAHFFPVHAVSEDVFNNTRLCWTRVQQLGYQRIGCVPLRHDPPLEDDAARFGAFAYGQKWEVPIRQRVPILPCTTQERERFLQWVTRYRPEVVIAFSIWASWLVEEGWRIPEEIAFASLFLGKRDANRGKAGILADAPQLGEAAVHQLDLLMRTNQRGLPSAPLTQHLEGQWIDGASCPRNQSVNPPPRQ